MSKFQQVFVPLLLATTVHFGFLQTVASGAFCPSLCTARSVQKSDRGSVSPVFSSVRINPTTVDNSRQEKVSDNNTPKVPEERRTFLDRVRRMLRGNSQTSLTYKQRIAKMGISALLSFAFVQNMSVSVSVSVAWYAFAQQTGLSPLAPGQWKSFSAVYAGFFAMNTVLRPFMFGLSMTLVKWFDRSISWAQTRLGLCRGAAVGIVALGTSFLGTLVAMGLGVFVASAVAGVPVFV